MKVHNIEQHLKENTQMNQEMRLYAPEEFLLGGQIGDHDGYLHSQVSKFHASQD